MLDHLTIKCSHCEASHFLSIAYVKGMIKAMKIGKVGEVAQQLKEKRGPFYDRWKVAMDLRGEQKRCRDCVLCSHSSYGYVCEQTFRPHIKVNPGQFACMWFQPKFGD